MNAEFQVLGRVECVVRNAVSEMRLTSQRVRDNASHLGGLR